MMMELIKIFFRRIYYLRSFFRFRSCGKNVIFSGGGKFIRPECISLGDNIFIGRNFHISARDLSIGNNVMIGPNLVIESDDHIFNKIGVTMFNTRDERVAGVVNIENDVWIGASVIILKDVAISEGCVVGAGSIVTKSLPPYTICVGTPCRPIKARFSSSELQKHLELVGSRKKFDTIIEYYNKYNLDF